MRAATAEPKVLQYPSCGMYTGPMTDMLAYQGAVPWKAAAPPERTGLCGA